jgi:glycosyltransferase involved in cell wall biosynthesis
MPRVLIEGAAMAKPLLASDVRGCREVTPPEVGLRVPVRDAPALARAMVALAADADLRARLGAAGRARALREHDLPAIVARVVAVYDRLLAARGIG